MNHSPAYIMAQYLIGQGLAKDPGDSGDWPIYVANLPDGENVVSDAVACMDTAPVKDGRVMEGEAIFHYGVQLLVRTSDYTTGYAKGEALIENLETINNFQVDIGGDAYIIQNVSPTTGVVAIGQDDRSRREMFSLNFLVTIEEV